MRRTTIYMPLLDEGTEVWVQVSAEALGNGLYKVLGIMPPEQNWRFQPGSVVALQERAFSSGDRGFEAVEAES
ncbi:hypothetical protein [Parvibaculum sp.]|uniref:hypothetical protein n=1 Tax=Parvibaculum sp. TaxID=2024848 RepID=UPI002730DDCD|nr:hypothetical protein [Parvibaculum sp.]MDP1628291.1 hypothetical protein [Parvibaculum sp.]MDP2149990.1 hypothetical protein [Parvibaculum sp.]MDP3330281.1 hypothetical protein [Parvibaculum sp.]